MKKRILIADSIATDGVEYLRSQPDFDVEVRPGLDEAGLGAIVAPFHAVIVRSATRITAKIMDCATSLQVIGRAGIGV
ncbi:MAG TPA: phosphoglycerate dehydrogenase, partial [Gammaproteobacteria bacterium]